jgi:hypothetical protein
MFRYHVHSSGLSFAVSNMGKMNGKQSCRAQSTIRSTDPRLLRLSEHGLTQLRKRIVMRHCQRYRRRQVLLLLSDLNQNQDMSTNFT